WQFAEDLRPAGRATHPQPAGRAIVMVTLVGDADPAAQQAVARSPRVGLRRPPPAAPPRPLARPVGPFDDIGFEPESADDDRLRKIAVRVAALDRRFKREARVELLVDVIADRELVVRRPAGALGQAEINQADVGVKEMSAGRLAQRQPGARQCHFVNFHWVLRIVWSVISTAAPVRVNRRRDRKVTADSRYTSSG